MKILIKYADDEIVRLEKIAIGNWVDMRSAKDVTIKKGEFALIPLGVAMKLPDGFEAHVVPRSSTFKNFGVIQTNHMGVIDNSYSGNDDWWFFPAFALRDTEIHKNDRICQFRIEKVQPNIEFEEVDELSSISRGGHGSTGIS